MRRLVLILIFVPSLLNAAIDWPSFRGPNSNGTIVSDSRFAAEDGGMIVAWRAKIGPGYSGVVVAEGRAVTMFSDGKDDVMAAFDLQKGSELWRYRFADTYKGQDGSYDGPIATPVISDGRVFGFGPRGEFFAVDLASGKELWSFQATKAFGTAKPHYGFASSPLITAGILVVQIGADLDARWYPPMIAAFDPATGKKKWALGEDHVNYQSPIILRFEGKDQLVAVGDKMLLGIDPEKGSLLWAYEHAADPNLMSAESLVPVPADEGRLLLKNKSDTSTLIRLFRKDGKIQVEPVWTAGVLRSTYSLAAYHEGYFYGYNNRVLTCVNAENGELKWRSREPGDGFLIIVDGNLIVQTKVGSLHVAPASPEGWKESARIDLFSSVSWTPPSFAGGAVYSRSMNEIARLEWRSQVQPHPATVAPSSQGSTSFAQFLNEIETAQDKNAIAEKFLSSISSFPLTEWPDHVYFLYKGQAEDMAIAGDMIGERNEESMQRVPGADLFWYHTRLEPDARINYRFVRNYEEMLIDPRNERKTKDYRDKDLSWFGMPGWNGADHLLPAASELQGKIESREFASKQFEKTTVKLDIYLPAGYEASHRRYPSLYVFSGPAARTEGMMNHSFDHWIAQSSNPFLGIFISDVKFENPPKEDEDEINAYAAIVANEIVPYIDSNYRTTPNSLSRAAAGNGFDGFYAFYTVFKHPGIFSSVSGQSVFMLESDEKLLKKEMRSYAEQPLRIYQDWGLYDLRAIREAWDNAAMNRRFNAYLREKGYRPAGGETHEGFGWASWRNRTDRWLRVLFPGS